MLEQLLDNLNKLTTVTDKFVQLEDKAKKAPVSSEDILELIRLSHYEMNEDEFPGLNQEQVLLEFNECRHVLVETGNYFYI